MSVSTKATDDFIEALATLQTRIVDALAGFDEMSSKAEPKIRGVIAEWIALHKSHNAVLSKRLSELGRAPDEDGSFFSTVQRAVIKTRAFFDDIDEDVLSGVTDGESRILDLYDEALRSALTGADRTILEGQKAEITTLKTKTESMG